VRTRVLATLAVALLTLAACDKPKPRPAAAPPPPAKGHTTDPLPEPPEWLTVLLGRNYAQALPEKAPCIGNTDVVGLRYDGASPGTQIIGWGWDPTTTAPVQRVIIVDGAGTIVGGGQTGLARPDVTAARPEVTSPTTGWSATTTLTKGAVDTYGIVANGRGACFLGHMEL
jgi:hypothetical protein